MKVERLTLDPIDPQAKHCDTY